MQQPERLHSILVYHLRCHSPVLRKSSTRRSPCRPLRFPRGAFLLLRHLRCCGAERLRAAEPPCGVAACRRLTSRFPPPRSSAVASRPLPSTAPRHSSSRSACVLVRRRRVAAPRPRALTRQPPGLCRQREAPWARIRPRRAAHTMRPRVCVRLKAAQRWLMSIYCHLNARALARACGATF